MRLPQPLSLRTSIRLLLLSGLFAFPVAGQSGGPWIERADLSLNTVAPTSAERLLDAEVLIVADYDLEWDPVLQGWWLDVDPWTTLHGTGSDSGDPPLCAPTNPFYGQPTSGRLDEGQIAAGCSGFLVAPNLVVSAGHCIAPPSPSDPWTTEPEYDCSHRYVVFDFADHGPVPPLEEIFLANEQVVRCDVVLVDTALGPEGELQPLGFGGADWALLQLAPSPVFDRLPLVVERSSQTKPGDPIVVIGHPARIPVKAELTTATGASSADLHLLKGNSGSAMVNLETGKVFGNLTNGGLGWYIWDPVGLCYDLCFECPPIGATGTSSLAWLANVPAIGLQVTGRPRRPWTISVLRPQLWTTKPGRLL